jgi:hypothetical protein
MRFLGGHSCRHDALSSTGGLKSLINFIKLVDFGVKNEVYHPAITMPYFYMQNRFSLSTDKLTVEKSHNFNIVCITAYRDRLGNLASMIEILRRTLPNDISIINLFDYLPFYGCSGCESCSEHGTCDSNDSFFELYKNVIKNAQAIIYCCNIDSHAVDFMVKRCIDRSFRFSGERKVLAFMLSGMLSKENQVTEWVNAYSGISGHCLAGVVSDESGREAEITDGIGNLSKRIIRILESGASAPTGFYRRGSRAILAKTVHRYKAALPAEYKAAQERGLYSKSLPKKEAVKRLSGITILRKILFCKPKV